MGPGCYRCPGRASPPLPPPSSCCGCWPLAALLSRTDPVSKSCSPGRLLLPYLPLPTTDRRGTEGRPPCVKLEKGSGAPCTPELPTAQAEMASLLGTFPAPSWGLLPSLLTALQKVGASEHLPKCFWGTRVSPLLPSDMTLSKSGRHSESQFLHL